MSSIVQYVMSLKEMKWNTLIPQKNLNRNSKDEFIQLETLISNNI